MRLPDFVIIGAAKSGTTTLYQQFLRHPGFFMSEPKEPTYFARDERYNRGEDWYSSLFEPALPDQVCGEASTNYTNITEYPETINRMKALLPDAKLVYIMRHPVDRAYSHYKQLISNKRYDDPDYKVQDSFEEHIKKDRSVIDSSNYILQIEAFLEHYRRDQFLFLFDTELRKDLNGTLRRVCEFLEVSPEGFSAELAVAKSNDSAAKDDWLIREKLLEPFTRLPAYDALSNLLPRSVKDRIFSILANSPRKRHLEQEYIPPPMLDSTRAELLAFFATPNKKLEEFLDTKLPDWSI